MQTDENFKRILEGMVNKKEFDRRKSELSQNNSDYYNFTPPPLPPKSNKTLEKISNTYDEIYDEINVSPDYYNGNFDNNNNLKTKYERDKSSFQKSGYSNNNSDGFHDFNNQNSYPRGIDIETKIGLIVEKKVREHIQMASRKFPSYSSEKLIKQNSLSEAEINRMVRNYMDNAFKSADRVSNEIYSSTDINQNRNQDMNKLIEKEVNNRVEKILIANMNQTKAKSKSNEFGVTNDENIIEQQVQSRILEIKEKERKEMEHNRSLEEMEKRLSNMFMEGLQQQREQFQKEKNAFLNKTKSNEQSIYQAISQNKLNFQNDLNELNNSRSNQKKNFQPEVNFGSARGGEYHILLLGGTGTGKSTLINTMANYFLGGSLENPKVVIPTKYFRSTESGYSSQHSESALDDVTKSKTTKCLTYTFTHPNNRSLKFVFIDSPGLSDTEGTKQDDKNIDEIINSAINAGNLSAIIVIANGTESRVTPSIRNTLVRLANNLPDELIDNNLLLVLTKCSKLSASFSEDAFAAEISKPKEVYYMDNQAFCSDPKIWQIDSDAYEELQLKWKQSHRTFDNLLKHITGMSNTSTDSFKNMKDLRNKLKAEISTISQDIANIQKVQDSLEAAQKAAQKTGDQKNSFSNYTQSETITLKSILPADYHSTVCTTHLIQDIICHEGCGLEFTEQSGNDYFSGCACMRGNQICYECGCGPTSHYHAMVKLETKTNTIQKVLEDMKAQFEAADADYQKFNADQNNFQSSLNQLQAAVDQKYQKIHQLCHDLSNICSRFNFVDELHANIENMKQDARTIKNSSLRQNAEDEIKKLVKLANDLSSNQGSKKVKHSTTSVSSNNTIASNFGSQNITQNNSKKTAKGIFKNIFK